MDKKNRVLKVQSIGKAIAEEDTGEICIFLNESADGFLLLVPEKEPWSEHDYSVTLSPGAGQKVEPKVGFANLLTGPNAGMVEIVVPSTIKDIFVNLEPTISEKPKEAAA